MSQKVFNRVRLFHEEGFRPTTLKNGGTILRGQGRLSVKMAKSNREKTPAGRFYEQYTGDMLPDGALDSDQVPVRVMNSEFITVRGKRRDSDLGSCSARLGLHRSWEHNFTST